jgi:hypothetical protein
MDCSDATTWTTRAVLFGVSAVDEASGKVAQSLTYGFEAADRISAITNAAGQPARQDFGYDARGPAGMGTRSVARAATI